MLAHDGSMGVGDRGPPAPGGLPDTILRSYLISHLRDLSIIEYYYCSLEDGLRSGPRSPTNFSGLFFSALDIRGRHF